VVDANYTGESLTARVKMTKKWNRDIRQCESRYQKHEELPVEVEHAMLKLAEHIANDHSNVLNEFRIIDKDGSGSLTIEVSASCLSAINKQTTHARFVESAGAGRGDGGVWCAPPLGR